MSTLRERKMLEQRERAAARRFEMENLPPAAAPRAVNNIWGGDESAGPSPAATPKTGKRQMAPASRAAPFADHAPPDGDSALAAYVQHRGKTSGVVRRTADGGYAPAADPPAPGPSPQKMAQMNAMRNQGRCRPNFFSGGSEPDEPMPRGKRGPPARDGGYDVINGERRVELHQQEPRAPPAAYDMPDAAQGLGAAQRAYAVRANQARGGGQNGPRGGGPSYGGANGNGSQNVGNHIGDRNSSRVLAPPGGFSSVSFG